MRATAWRRALTVAVAALLPFTGLTMARAADSSPVSVLSCLQSPEVKPAALVTRCTTADVAWSSVTWSSWGSATATGKGHLLLNNCLPSCAKGHVHAFAASLVLSKVRQTGGYGQIYSSARFSFVAKGKRVTKTVSLLEGLGTPPVKLKPATTTQGAFLSPLPGLNCEMDLPGTGPAPLPASVFCETFTPAKSVTLSAAGVVKTCVAPKGTFGCIGDPGEGTPTLAYGKAMVLGPFRCLSSKSGVLCITTKGSGFSISLNRISVVHGY